MNSFRLPLYTADKIPFAKPSDEVEEESWMGEIFLLSKVQEPDIVVYLPEKEIATGQAVILCPGGGYQFIAYHWEGTEFAKKWVEQGVAAIVLKYRLPSARSQTSPHLCPLTDAQRAIRLVRQHAEEWNLNPDRIGMMGFSAGGHLASSASTQYDLGDPEAADPVDRLSSRPDFSILVYGALSFSADFVHVGSRSSLLGPNPDEALRQRFSTELHVNADTPPTLLVHSVDDDVVPCEHSLLYAAKLREHKVPSTLHLYPRGGHGYALATNDPFLSTWVERCFEWVKDLRSAS